MNSKVETVFLIVLVVCSIIFGFLGNKIYTETRSIPWSNGDDIKPLPEWSIEFDCDDETLYTYYWIRQVRPNYILTPMRSENHIWLLVKGDSKQFVYDGGHASDPATYEYDGKSVYLEALIREVEYDFLNVPDVAVIIK
jgi:hypothetical protein